MLVKFSTQNFLSFCEKIELNMIPSLQKSNEENLIKNDTLDVLKFGVIYGANASGKSNLVKAMGFVPNLLSSGVIAKYKNYYCRNDFENKNKSTKFEYTFLCNNNLYCYELDVILDSCVIIEENMYYVNPNTGNTKTLLSRRYDRTTNENIFESSIKFTASTKNRLNTYFNDFKYVKNKLFLGEMKDKIFKEKELEFIPNFLNWFVNILDVNYAYKPIHNFMYFNNIENNRIIEVLKRFDTGVSNLEFVPITREELKNKINNEEFYTEIFFDINNIIQSGHKVSIKLRNEFDFITITGDSVETLEYKELNLSHKNSFSNFKYGEESDGTRRLFDLMDILLGNDNKVYVVDEIERSLHPVLLYEFISTFKDYFQKRKIQLIISTHETHIMNQQLFRRDEIWFVEKNKNSNSCLYSLDIFKERIDKKLEPNYLDGRYGAIPIINKFYQEV